MNLLGQWEKTLAEHVARVVLLGEIQITEDEAQVLTKNVRWLVDHEEKWPQAFKILQRNYPNCLAVTLVTQAIYAYREGDYWSQVQSTTGLADSQGHQQRLGQFFIDFLIKRGLPRFPNLAEIGHRYVTPILMHAGIPNALLPDYFMHFVQPMLKANTGFELQAEEMIDKWLNQKHYAIPVPLQRFLRYGDKVAADFVARSLDYAEAKSNGEDAMELTNMPLRVQESFDAWFAMHPWQLKPHIVRHRLTAPVLRADPWGITPLIELPEQHLPSEMDSIACEWTITVDNDERKLAMVAHRSGQTRNTPSAIAVIAPAEHYHVTFRIHGHINQAWEYTGRTAKRPLFAFDPTTDALLRWRSVLPGRVLNLLLPSDATCEVVGGHRHEQLPGYGNAWHGYRFEQWDLTLATEVRINEIVIPIENDAAVLRPSLMGMQDDALISDDLVFVAIPDAVIPVAPSRTCEEEASLWQARLIGMTGELWCGPVTALAYEFTEGVLHVSLANILPDEPYSSFTLALRGPLGRDLTQRFTLLPPLSIVDRQPLRYPNAQGVVPSGDFCIKLDPTYVLASAHPQVDVINMSSNTYHIKVPTELTQAPLIVCSRHSEKRIPLTIALPQLQWAFVEDIHVLQNYEWQTRPFLLDESVLDQAPAPALLVTTSLQQVAIAPRVTFAYHPHTPSQELQPQRHNAQQWIFPLGALKDTLGYATCGNARLCVQLADKEIPLVSITQDPDFWLQAIDNCLVDGTWILSVQWSEKRHLQHRYLLLWSLERPWEAPYSIDLPDTVNTTFDWELSEGKLPPGRYRAGIGIRDLWSAHLPPMPSIAIANVHDIKLGTAAEHMQHITALPPTTLGMLECIAAEQANAAMWQVFRATFDTTFMRPALRTLGMLQDRLRARNRISPALQGAISQMQAVLNSYPTEYVRLFLDILEPMERQIVETRFGISNEEVGTSLAECLPADIGKRIGLPTKRIQQILESAFKKMRAHARQLGDGDLLQEAASTIYHEPDVRRPTDSALPLGFRASLRPTRDTVYPLSQG